MLARNAGKSLVLATGKVPDRSGQRKYGGAGTWWFHCQNIGETNTTSGMQ